MCIFVYIHTYTLMHVWIWGSVLHCDQPTHTYICKYM